jgi:hypothetical protein
MTKGDKFKIIKHCCNQFHKLGDVLCFDEDDGTSCPWFINMRTGGRVACNISRLEPIKEVSTMRYKENDVLVDRDGYKKTVLGVCGKVYLMSLVNKPNKSDSGFTQQELDERGWKLFTGKDDEVEKAIKLLEEKGVVKNGIILKRYLK